MCAWTKSCQLGDEEKLLRKRKVYRTEAEELWERRQKKMEGMRMRTNKKLKKKLYIV